MGKKKHPVFSDKSATEEDRERVRQQAVVIRKKTVRTMSDISVGSDASTGK